MFVRLSLLSKDRNKKEEKVALFIVIHAEIENSVGNLSLRK